MVPTQEEVERAIRRLKYRDDPVGYAREVLRVEWWSKQVEIAEALLRYKRVFVKASHAVGKSFLAGGLVNWFFDCFDPGVCITTAPNAPQVRDILWKEVRVQRPVELHGALQPKAPRMETGPDHFAVGYTSRDGSGFQGRHEEHVLIVFDECVGVAGEFWDAAEGMMTGDNCYFLAMCNPTDTGSRAYMECMNSEKWHVIQMSALEHPNIAADLAGRPAPYPKAVRLSWVKGKLKEWCTPSPPKSPSPRIPSLRSAGEGDLTHLTPTTRSAGTRLPEAGRGRPGIARLLPTAHCLLPVLSSFRWGVGGGGGRGLCLRAGCWGGGLRRGVILCGRRRFGRRRWFGGRWIRERGW